MNTVEQFNHHCAQPSDINELLPYLIKYATGCKHITEMGTRRAVSTYAFLMAKPEKLVCYDIARWEDVDALEIHAKEYNVPLEFHQANVLEIEIEETDFLFIDTYHSYEQLKRELAKHSDKVRRYIAMHDTQTFRFSPEPFYDGVHPDCMSDKGLWYAVEEFLNSRPEWKIIFETPINNGLTVIGRI